MVNNKSRDPDDIYVGFVRSLFNEPGILLIGAFVHFLIGLLVYHHSQDTIYIVLAFGMLVGGLYRYQIIKRGKVARIDDIETARQWERLYLIGGTIQGFVAGLFAFVSLYWSPDIFGEIAAVSVLMGSTVTIAGRNYGSRAMVTILTISVVAPIAVGLMLKGDVHHIVLGLYIIPFMVVITKVASQVRSVLFTAISEQKKATRLAQRFNRALNTMSHGLVMLSPEGRVVVANSEAAQLMRVKNGDKLLGRSLRAVLMRGVAGGLLSQKDARFAESQLTRALREGRDRKLLLRFSNGRHFEFSAREGHDDLGVIIFEDVTQRVAAEEKIRFMARYDNLTGLPNRAYFHESVGEAMGAGDRNRYCGIAVFDLDDFKSVNDTLGHPVGDGLIYAVAEKLAVFASDDVKVSRFGGDEFMLYFDHVADRAEFGSMLDDIFASVLGDVDVAGHSLRVQVSAGAVFQRVQDTDVDEMIVKADLALYKAKEQGKNGWCLFEQVMDAAFRNRQVMKADLRNAIETKSLRVVYQPIVAMETMRIASCEALCRWDHPEMGPISPAVFIPLAEEMGIIAQISEFVLGAACRECMNWPDQISVSVNLSAKDFRDRDIVDKVRAALAESGLAPHRLEIEVTETALLDDKSSTRQYLEELKALGVGIALDDFGTGYSSLSYLHTLPLDKVKIDRSFLMDVTRSDRSLELLKGIVNLSRPLGLAVTIEGVETFDQLKVLEHVVKPDLVQGFLFGSALTPSGIQTMSNTVWPFAAEAEQTGQTPAAALVARAGH
ncbi:MAG: EAL domain-containing protein [Brucellaceae bacterium]|nr:EAL domain-containing protein [Brucellaceae bacterium]